jgi:hypothetical protein
MELSCGEEGGRKKITLDDFTLYYQEWDAIIQQSISYFFEVNQPLILLVDNKKTKNWSI